MSGSTIRQSGTQLSKVKMYFELWQQSHGEGSKILPLPNLSLIFVSLSDRASHRSQCFILYQFESHGTWLFGETSFYYAIPSCLYHRQRVGRTTMVSWRFEIKKKRIEGGGASSEKNHRCFRAIHALRSRIFSVIFKIYGCMDDFLQFLKINSLSEWNQ